MSDCTVFFLLTEYALVNILMGDIIDGEESAPKKGIKSMFLMLGSTRMSSSSQQVYIHPLTTPLLSPIPFSFSKDDGTAATEAGLSVSVTPQHARLLDPAATEINSSRRSGRRVYDGNGQLPFSFTAANIGSIKRPRSTTRMTDSRNRRGNDCWCPSSLAAFLAIAGV